jgi:DNA-binding XRE family transcriptional regulator
MRVVNETIKGARTRLGMELHDVAQRSGLSWNEYYDVELHPSEALDVVNLRHLKTLCAVLGLDLLDLFEIDCAFCGAQDQAPVVPPRPRDDLVRRQRAKFGLSQDQLGDLIGFEAVAIVEIEKDPEYLEGWSIRLVVELAGYLDIPAQWLLGVACRKCGR